MPPPLEVLARFRSKSSVVVDASSATERMRNLKMTQNVLTFTALGK